MASLSILSHSSHDVLGVTSGIEDMGHLRPELLGLLFLAWVIVYFCLWKSVRATGKVMMGTEQNY